MEFAPPRGMRDFYPEDFRAREALFDIWRRVSALHGFQGYDAPVVETEELLTRKGGEEITRQIYTFTDKSDRRLALRPEMTPSLARMIIARQGSLTFPLKWYAIPQCFRYERTTRGRKREHYQWNLDVVGEASIMAEAEVIGTAVDAMREIGLTSQDFKVRIGNRALLAQLFKQIGIGEEHFAASCLALDKRGKISDAETRDLLAVEGLKENDILRVFELVSIQSLDEARGALGADSPAITDVESLFSIAGEMGFADFLLFDISIVRGLGYYTGIVFEAFDTAKKFRAIFGGGRYDNLLTSLGGQACPSVGLGFGDVVIQEFLEDTGRPLGAIAKIDYAIGYMNEDCRAMAIRVAASRRAKKMSVELALAPEKPKKFFSRVDKIGAAKAIYIGPDEVSGGRVKVKDMQKHSEELIPAESL